MRFDEPESVTVNLTRWEVTIRIVDSEGIEHEYVASADLMLTAMNGIFFGTREEYREAL